MIEEEGYCERLGKKGKESGLQRLHRLCIGVLITGVLITNLLTMGEKFYHHHLVIHHLGIISFDS